MDGHEQLDQRGADLKRVASVASLFVSRLDALMDPLFETPIPGQDAVQAGSRTLRDTP